MEFNTIAVSDGVSMGTEGMKASLVSREVVADSIELVARGHLFDGVVCDLRLRQDGPGSAMALGRLDIPGARPLLRHDPSRHPVSGHGRRRRRLARRNRGDDLRGDRSLSGRQDHARRAVRGRERVLSRAGRLRRPVHGEHDEHGHGGSRSLASRPQRDPGRGPGQGRGGAKRRRAGHAPRPRRHPPVGVRHAVPRSTTRSRQWPRPGGSTNAVLHLLAIAHEFGIPLEIDEFDDDRRPDARSSPTSSRAAATPRPTSTRRAGWPWSSGSSLPVGGSTARRRNVDGRTTAEIAAAARPTEGQVVVLPIDRPLKPTGGLAILRGSLAPGRLRRQAGRP